MPEDNYRPDILEILRTVIYEKNYPLLEGGTPDSKFIAGNNLSLRFSLLQLALVDTGLFFSFIQIAAGSTEALGYLYLFLVILNSIVIFLLYLIVHETNRKMTKKEEGYWYSLYFSYCKTYNIGTIDREDTVLHKIENPEHVIGKYNVRVKIYEMSKFMDIFRLPEIMTLLLVPSAILLLGNFFNFTLLKELFFLPYLALIILYTYRRLKRWKSRGKVNLLKINLIRRNPNAPLDIFTMKLITVDIRYFKNEIHSLDKFPLIVENSLHPTYLIEHYKTDFLNNVTAKAYSGLPPGLYIL